MVPARGRYDRGRQHRAEWFREIALVETALRDVRVLTRRLNDGREFRIVKIFYEPVELERRLAALGWDGWIRSSGQFFSYGSLHLHRT